MNSHNDDINNIKDDVTATESEANTPSASADSNLPYDDVDDYVFAHYRRSKSKKHHNNHSHYGKDHSQEEKIVLSTSEPHYRDKKNRKRYKRNNNSNRPWWKKLLIVLAWIIGALLTIGICLVIAFSVSCSCGMKTLTNYNDMNMTAPVIDNASVQVGDSGKTVFYKGVTYSFNSDVTSILCIGVDKHELGTDGSDRGGTGGQADALYMIALDTDTGKTKIFAIPRDIVTDIGIYNASGEYLGTEKHQLCLSYAYGDGRETSCKNTVTAVSRLFYQLPINTYFAIDISAIDDLNDAVGGVTVTLKDNYFYDTNFVRRYAGETITLYGANASKYVRVREVSDLESTTDRMSRQINYLEAFTSKALSMTKQDLSTPVTLYNIVQENSETNLTTSTITALATCLISNGVTDIEFIKVPGTLTSDGTYAEYVVDEEAFYEMILDVYYTPVQ